MRSVALTGALAGTPAAAADWPATLGYVLQAEGLAAQRADAVRELAASGRDLLVLDAAFSVGEHGAWTRAELDAVRAGAPGRRVVCYLSIGEAEAYRDYFAGLADSDLLLEENPNWQGNFKVRYWREDWQRLIAARAAALMEQGFDGVYLDIVDAYQHFEHDAQGAFHPGRVNAETGASYRAEMVRFVRRIASAVRAVRPEALVIPQNGSDLLHDAALRAAVDGIGLEDLFTLNDAPQDPAHTGQVLDNLAALHGTQHFVLVIEYAGTGKERAHALQRAGEPGYVLLLTDRALNTLGTSYAPMNWTERRPR
jgi:cysteinyl-tRNA synthetase